MRLLNLAVLAAFALGSPALVGCSANGDSDLDGPAPNDPSPDEQDAGTVEPDAGQADATVHDSAVPTPSVDAGHHDGSVHDSGAHDTGNYDAADAHVIEAGTDAGPAGSACTPRNSVEQQSCGLCGFQTRVCAPKDADAGSPNVWQPWGYCQAEVANGCAPGSTMDETCGFCGTRQKICQLDCTYAVGSCKNQPVDGCAPGSTEFQVGLSCPNGGRNTTCSAQCTWGSFSECYVPDAGVVGPALTISGTAGTIVTGTFKLDAATTTARLGQFDTCPNATVGTVATAYQYVQIVNTTSKTATVSVWSAKSTSAGALELSTVLAAYAGSAPPVTATERAACIAGVASYCDDFTDPTSCQSGWGGLMKADNRNVTVKPYSSVFVYVAAAGAPTATAPNAGEYLLSARTDTIR